MELKYSDVFYVIKNFLSKEECETLIDEYESNKNNSSKEISGNAITNTFQKASFNVVPISTNSKNFNLVHKKTQCLIEKWMHHLESFNCFYTEYLKQQIKYAHSYRILKYNVGGSIHPHSDWGNFIHASATLNLNDSYSGGEFVFFNGKCNVALGQGDALIFPADCFWVHEVKPVISGARYSVNSFLCSLPYELLMQLNNQIKIMSCSPIIKNEFYFENIHSDKKEIRYS